MPWLGLVWGEEAQSSPAKGPLGQGGRGTESETQCSGQLRPHRCLANPAQPVPALHGSGSQKGFREVLVHPHYREEEEDKMLEAMIRKKGEALLPQAGVWVWQPSP